VVVRTHGEPEGQPQYLYRPPSLVINASTTEPIVQRWLQGLRLMIRSDHAGYEAAALDILGRSDLYTAYLVLEQAYQSLGDLERVAPLVAAVARRHGPVVSEITASLRQRLQRRKLHRLRSATSEPELRFFLALLQNLPDKEAIYAMVRGRYPQGDARAWVLGWVHALSGVERIGVDFDDELNLVLFEALLDGCGEAEMIERLKDTFDPEEVDAQRGALGRLAEQMQKTAILPLFRGGS
jgi:hypothetical protein